MTTILIAIACAMLAACFFAAAVALQHNAVRTVNHADSVSVGAFGRIVRSRRWLTGTSLAITGTALHVTALSLAPLAIVQPIGVLSLVLTVALSRRTVKVPHLGKAVAAVCAGVAGFVVLAALTGSASTTAVHLAQIQPLVVGALGLAALGLCTRGRGRCLVLATSTAILYGLGSALVRLATQDVLTHAVSSGLPLAGEAGVLMLVGGWLLHQAYAAGPTAVVIAATTVIDPLTAVTVGLVVYGEAARANTFSTALQLCFALLAVGGVLVLARSVPDSAEPKEREMPTAPEPGRPLRILISADTFPPDINGAAHFAARLAHGLAGRGHDVHVVCPATARGPREDVVGAITVHRVASWRTPFHPDFRVCSPGRAAKAAGPLIERLRPDVVHVQSHFSLGRAILKAASERGIATVATNHFMPENLLGYAPIPHGLKAPLARWAWRDLVRVYRQADVVTAPTPRAVELLATHGLPEAAHAVSCGIDVAHYAPERREIHTRGTSVLFVGRLDREKNVDELIRAVATLPGVRAELVGDGACRQRLTELAEYLGVAGRIRFHGVVSDADLVRAYRRCDVFCMPGTAELQSLATMEAMSAGLPVVAANAMALPHLVHHGVNGFLYTPGNINELAGHLATLTQSQEARAEMGDAGRQIITGHDIGNTLTAFGDLYRKTLGATEPSAALTS
ncbi:MAG: glucosyltransferase [Amycolatopsis sp.]|uniref:glycosyltransferase n=1 Tax=Amycolatopsis sp. TaxID=37632 RepID=UPI002632BCC7|nr:glycosyltransferase [Amycolatopsis sp.]MCU1680277.1 glucosyltransferase [Amycolatopsis sp.]